jgi:hypothetical protein
MRVKSLLAFVLGFSTVAIVAWPVANVRAQGSGPAAIDVCLAEDGTLRLAPPSASCPPNQKSLAFMSDVQPAPRDAMDPSSRARVAELERRVSDLEDAASRGELGNKVVEPFTVLSDVGKPIFVVHKASPDSDGAEVNVMNNGGKVVTSLRSFDKESSVFVSSPAKDLYVGFGRNVTWTGLVMREKDKDRISIGRTVEKAERYSLEVYGSDQKLAAWIGESKGGGGLVAVADHGVEKARMFLTDGTSAGTLGILRRGSDALALMTEADSGGGLFRILSASGVPMVEAIAGKGGFGVVAAGPGAFKSGAGLLGLPGSYIAGKPQ